MIFPAVLRFQGKTATGVGRASCPVASHLSWMFELAIISTDKVDIKRTNISYFALFQILGFLSRTLCALCLKSYHSFLLFAPGVSKSHIYVA